jgi:hypothetical protein
MPKDRVFAAGSLAKAYLEIAEWYGAHAEDINAQSVLTPFCGFGRLTSAIAREGVTVDVCDFQRLTSVIVMGVFAASDMDTNVDKPRFHKGKAYGGGFIKNMDPHSAGFLDWVVKYGTNLDVAAIGMSLPSQTMRGWLSTWTGNINSLYKKFVNTRQDFKEYIDYPGNWSVFEMDFFKLIGSSMLLNHYDVLAIDPPRLNITQDAYSLGWRKFNETLGGTVRVRPWTGRNYFTRLAQIMTIPSNYILFSWTEGKPDVDQIKDFLLSYGTLEDEQVWESHQKTIHAWRIRREGS